MRSAGPICGHSAFHRFCQVGSLSGFFSTGMWDGKFQENRHTLQIFLSFPKAIELSSSYYMLADKGKDPLLNCSA